MSSVELRICEAIGLPWPSLRMSCQSSTLLLSLIELVGRPSNSNNYNGSALLDKEKSTAGFLYAILWRSGLRIPVDVWITAFGLHGLYVCSVCMLYPRTSRCSGKFLSVFHT